jgi:hypothetical protein
MVKSLSGKYYMKILKLEEAMDDFGKSCTISSTSIEKIEEKINQQAIILNKQKTLWEQQIDGIKSTLGEESKRVRDAIVLIDPMRRDLLEIRQNLAQPVRRRQRFPVV